VNIYCLRKDFRYSVLVQKHSHHSHIQENTWASKIKHASCSSLGAYPGTVNILFIELEQRR